MLVCILHLYWLYGQFKAKFLFESTVKMRLGLLFTALALALLFVISGLFGYYVSYKTDGHLCPWAYSIDENKPVLVGKWAGKFIEPDSVEKKISLEIYEPYTKRERFFYSIGFAYSSRLWLKYNKFEGLLTIENKQNIEKYKVNGNVNMRDIQLFDFHLLENEKEVEPYYYSFLFTNGFWKQNDMSFLMTIIFHKTKYPNNLKNYDPHSNKKIKVFLSRIIAIS